MRFAWYAGISVALAGGVIVSAFHQRANFYSAMVYLSQSNMCLAILINLIFLLYGSFMYGLQRVCFGQLRPVEIEQLYEKAWFAVTETCLAMTVFRDQVGGFFLAMFTALVTGKVWGWISEGRVEVLEQQPPANPRLFHARLTTSLIMSLVYDIWLLRYAVSTVIQQARPDMMVMFLFEFAILALTSLRTTLRYGLLLLEAAIVKKQTHQRLEDRRRQVREQRAEILRRRESGEAAEDDEPLPAEEDVDEMDIEVPGWESKGQWVLSLDLWTDLLKLCIYSAFFFVLFTFYGLPLHILRDLIMTARSFVKRLGALLKYRQAVRDMNKYPDATEEELARENTCIICREEMHPWNPHDATSVERYRPKKLPCGHILHVGCLRSWMERQQVCPTCRRSVVIADGPAARNREAMVFRVGLNLPGGGGQNQAGVPPPAGNGAAGGQGAPNNAPQPGNGARNGVRMFNLGPLRLGFAQGGVQDIQDMAQRLAMPLDGARGDAAPPAVAHPPQAAPTQTAADAPASAEAIHQQLREVEQRIQQQSASLRVAEHEAHLLRLLLTELQRIRQMQAAVANQMGTNTAPQAQPGVQLPAVTQLPLPQPPPPPLAYPQPYPPQFAQPLPNFAPLVPRMNSPSVMRLTADPNTTAIPAGSPELPEGVTIPSGWSLMPLQRLDGSAVPGSAPAASTSAPPDFLTPRHASPQPGTAQQQASSSSSILSGATTRPLNPLNPLNPTSQAPSVLDASFSGAGVASSGPRPEITRSEVVGSSSSPATGTEPRASEPAPMAQPTPVAPNWGGSGQLFSGGRPAVLGYQLDRAEASTPAQPEAAGRGEERADSAQAAVAGSSDAVAEQQEEGQSGGGTAKGKARAVTVEEADDDDEA